MPKSKLIWLVLLTAAVIFFHNVMAYPPKGGFDYLRRTTYSRITSEQFRLPTYAETSEVYDAPAFYFLSGLTARTISAMGRLPFLEALADVRYLTASLGLASFFLWYKIFSYLNPKNKLVAVWFMLFLASVPVFYRAGAMIVSEPLTVFNASLSFYFFITKFLPKPTFKKAVILGLLLGFGLLTRITFFAIIFAISIGVMLVFLQKRQFLTGVKFLTIMSVIILGFSGWFYLGRQGGKLLDFGTVKELYDQMPKHESIRLDFYYYVPFKLLMNYPVRPYLSYPSYLLPIYYADFWGDYWNYFAQSRFGPNEFAAAKAHRESISAARRQYLAWQMQINLIPTLVMVAAFLYCLTTRTLAVFKRRPDRKIIVEFIFCVTVIFIWGSLLAIITKYPGGEGDWIKAQYSLLIVPIYIYCMTVFLFSVLKKIKFIYWPTLVVLFLAIINNFIFSWF